MNNIITIDSAIESKIFMIQGTQVMLDSDLAKLYQVETKQLNKAVNRNIERFPLRFRFQLTDEEYKYILRCQNGTSSSHGGRRYLPYVFTEQGVSMLSAVLRSNIAIDISIKIIDTFVNMRRFISSNSELLQRMEIIEKRQIGYELKSDDRFEKLFNALEDKSTKPTQGVFFDRQIFDAYIFINDLIKSANDSVILIDNYIDETVLTLFGKNQDVEFVIYTQSISKQLKLDIKKYNSQYNNLKVNLLKESHDRFIIIDKKELYHIGASLKDLGKKCFAFSMIVGELDGILARLESSDG